jgi:small conductance mechanosensitive channel
MLSLLLQVQPAADLVDACGASPGWACRRVYEATGNKTLAGAVDFILGAPLRILLIVVVALVVNALLRRAIRKFTNTIAGAAASDRLLTPRGVRASSRAQTIGSVLRSLSTAVVYTIAGVTILGELGVNLGPLIASAGIAGIAIGFGAQSLVKDFIAGVFMLVEDQYGVGDVIDVGEARGTVEAVGLRTTRLRDVEGTVWHVPNGQITRVGNKSQEWARALLDVSVAYDTDVRKAETIIKDVADSMYVDEDWSGKLLEEPEIFGVENLGANGVDIRVGIKTRPAEQFKVMRELRTRLKERFDVEKIDASSPQRTMWIATDGATAPDSTGEGDLDS